MCQNGLCMNTIGSFHCDCYTGYVYDEASHQCIDKNECSKLTNPCQGIAKCINTPGSFECTCPAGYQLDRSGRKCDDINECDEMISVCQHGMCRVFIQSYLIANPWKILIGPWNFKLSSETMLYI